MKNLSKKKRIHVVLQRKRGFTLLETLVAVAIMLTAVVAPLTVASRSINTSRLAIDQVTAAHLAQDSLEWVIIKRRQNVLDAVLRQNNKCDVSYHNCDSTEETNWLSDFVDENCANGCSIETSLDVSTPDTIQSCTTAEDCRLVYDDTTYAYGHNIAGDDTKFYRTVYVTQTAGNPDEAEVRVVVSWRSGLVTKQFAMKTSIFNILF